MKCIVPVIGCEFAVLKPLLKGRVEFLLSQRGYATEWVDEENVVMLDSAPNSEIYAPLIIDLIESSESVNHPDLLYPLQDHFKSAILITDGIMKVPQIIFQLTPQLSLWENIPPKDTYVRNAILSIYRNLSDTTLNVDKLARECCVSKNRLERLFKECYGCGLWHFVQHIRLQQAKRLLKETTLAVSEIASSVGYSDFPVFDKVFKKTFNLTPLKFRLG